MRRGPGAPRAGVYTSSASAESPPATAKSNVAVTATLTSLGEPGVARSTQAIGNPPQPSGVQMASQRERLAKLRVIRWSAELVRSSVGSVDAEAVRPDDAQASRTQGREAAGPPG